MVIIDVVFVRLSWCVQNSAEEWCDVMLFYSETYYVPEIIVQKNGMVYRYPTIRRFVPPVDDLTGKCETCYAYFPLILCTFMTR